MWREEWQRHGRNGWSDLRLESSNKIEAPGIPGSDSTDVALRLQHMANVSERRTAATEMTMVRWAMG